MAREQKNHLTWESVTDQLEALDREEQKLKELLQERLCKIEDQRAVLHKWKQDNANPQYPYVD